MKNKQKTIPRIMGQLKRCNTCAMGTLEGEEREN